MRRYVLNLRGYESTTMSASEIRHLFRTGAVTAATPCCRNSSSTWSTVDQEFPDLKHEVKGALISFAPGAGPMRREAARLLVAPSAGELMSLLGSRA